MFAEESWDTEKPSEAIMLGVSQKLPNIKVNEKSKTKQSSLKTKFRHITSLAEDSRISPIKESKEEKCKHKRNKKHKNKFKDLSSKAKIVGSEVRSLVNSENETTEAGRHVSGHHSKRRSDYQSEESAKRSKKEILMPYVSCKGTVVSPKKQKGRKNKSKKRKSSDIKHNSAEQFDKNDIVSPEDDHDYSESETEAEDPPDIMKKSIQKINVNTKLTKFDIDSLRTILSPTTNNKSELPEVKRNAEVSLSKPSQESSKAKKDKRNQPTGLADRMRERLNAARFRYGKFLKKTKVFVL